MLITKLKLQNYKQFTNYEVDLEKGVNVIYGENEAGKSTLSKALMDLFYSLPNSRSKELLANQTWQSDVLPVLTLEFNHNNCSYILIKDFQEKTSSLCIKEAKGAGKLIKGVPEVQRELVKILPFKDEGVFRGSAYISADDLPIVHGHDTTFNSTVQNIAIEGEGRVEIESIIKELLKQKSLLIRGMEKLSGNPGPIRSATNKITELSESLRQMSSRLESQRTQQKQLADMKIELTEKQERLVVVTKLIEQSEKDNKAHIELERIATDFSQLQKELDRRDELAKSLNDLEGKYESVEDFGTPETKQDLSELFSLQERINILTEGEGTKKDPVSWLKILLIPVVILIIGLLLAWLLQSYLVAVIGLGLAVLVSFYLATRNRSKYSDGESPILKAQVLVDTKLNKYALSLVELEKKVKTAQGLQAKINEITTKLDTLNESHSQTDLLDQRRNLIKQQLKFEELLDSADKGGGHLSAGEFASMELELQKLQHNIKDLETSQTKLETLLSQNMADDEQAALIEEQLTQEENKLQQAKQELEVTELIRAALEHAVIDTASASAELVEKEIEKYLPLITLNRYSRVKLNKDLSLQVFSVLKNDWCDPRIELSRGTLDQVYLLARLAYIRLLSKPGSIPVIMDDPFLTFDAKRLKAAASILQDFSNDYQVLFFTFNSRLQDLGRNLHLNTTAV